MDAMTWFYIFLAFLTIELITINLVTIWFAIGALVASFAAMYGMSIDVQITVFLVVSFALLIPLKPWAQKQFNKTRAKTNLDALVGKTAVVEQSIDTPNDIGKVKLNGMEWSAKTEDIDDIIPTGELVEVTKIEGVKLVVKRTEI